MRKINILIMLTALMLLASCTGRQTKTEEGEEFNYFVDQFEDMRVFRYRLPGFESLSLRQKELIYYLSEAALCGRDILWDQNFKYNLLIRKTNEAIIKSWQGDKETPEYKSFITWAKRVFFANGIHHHYSADKMLPSFSKEFYTSLVKGSDQSLLPVGNGKTADDLLAVILPVIFDPDLYPRKIERGEGKDIIAESAVNFYEGVTAREVESFYNGKINPADPRPVAIGLNSKLVKKNGRIVEEVYKSGGLYGEAIDRIIYWLEKAKNVAENEIQKKELEVLIQYYRTGDLKTWDDYNVLWARNTEPVVDYVNGFIEVYEDPMGMKATWEAIVDYKDPEATRRTETITANAQWFEDNSPVQPQYKKEKVTGVAAKVINIAMLGGDCYPASPIGINLPNSDWIRKEVGSKSVTLANISEAYDVMSARSGMLDEFAASKEEIERVRKYASIADALHTDLHECVGHASGKLAEGTDPNALKEHQSALEEARADLFALYYMMDNKLIELGLLPEKEAAMAEYDSYIRNGMLTQLVRIRPGKQIEQAHMRARAMIARWAYENGKDENVIELFTRDGKTFVKINDYEKLRNLFGSLLREVQRIKSEGDYEAGKTLIESYGVKVDPVLHNEMLARYEKLKLAPYTGFLNPRLVPVYNDKGEITDVKVEYEQDYLSQMIYYGTNYSFLPAILN
ncbi:MAG TPA: dihydrofolate reductase [Bacteroidales bacterium]|nr:dihydrofolate reductase [Bacteroidales bacterium]HOU31176.1 dihydrofolate reductase [Bacteroidales bacterium]HPP92735.1 dihydrofolate reductase [Bacteroidales bacterium]HQG55833.1 dihydrofolate reductase [Bacteroidales bacterium]HQK70230.1 dihydrofolate reductase [Bacteroidales bacterium]